MRRGASRKTLREPKWQQECQFKFQKTSESQDRTLEFRSMMMARELFMNTTLHNLNGVGSDPWLPPSTPDKCWAVCFGPDAQTLCAEVPRSTHRTHSGTHVATLWPVAKHASISSLVFGFWSGFAAIMKHRQPKRHRKPDTAPTIFMQA